MTLSSPFQPTHPGCLCMQRSVPTGYDALTFSRHNSNPKPDPKADVPVGVSECGTVVHMVHSFTLDRPL